MIKIKALFAALICSVSAMAQDIQLVTLQHGENMTAYYGADAFKSAMEASAAGDLITLSSGTFNATTINKAVTIQGAGYIQDADNNKNRTRIYGNFNVELPTDAVGLTIEGVFSDNELKVVSSATQLTIKRCHFQSISFSGQSKNCAVQQCRVGDFYPDAHSQNLLVQNSAVNSIYGNSDDAVLLFENCVIPFNGGSRSNAPYNPVVTYKNCIIANPSSNPKCIAYNNLWFRGAGDDLKTIVGQNNIKINSMSDVIEGDVTWHEPGELKLKEDAATKYLGTDGTQVGIYGGTNGFTDVPSNPQVTSKTIAPQSDTNGKLSVKITVEAQKN